MRTCLAVSKFSGGRLAHHTWEETRAGAVSRQLVTACRHFLHLQLARLSCSYILQECLALASRDSLACRDTIKVHVNIRTCQVPRMYEVLSAVACFPSLECVIAESLLQLGVA